jgi:ubiquinone/menaquinone biosynthesis C-methylase UbiE
MQPLTVKDGYASWSRTYDSERNPLIRLEERVIAHMTMETPRRVLDAACGTGRHAVRFAALDATVIGVDATPEMLRVSHTKARRMGLTRAHFVQASIEEALPVADRAMDLAICALALCHIRRLALAITNVCRTVRPGGFVLLTDLHPEAVQAGLVTLFSDEHGNHAIETVLHSRQAYLDGLAANGAELVAVSEAVLGEAFEQEPSGLPAGVYAVDWRRLPLCLVVFARIPAESGRPTTRWSRRRVS